MIVPYIIIALPLLLFFRCIIKITSRMLVTKQLRPAIVPNAAMIAVVESDGVCCPLLLWLKVVLFASSSCLLVEVASVGSLSVVTL